MLGGTHVCLRKVTAKNIYNSIAEHHVTHFCGAPIVMNMISNAPEEEQREEESDEEYRKRISEALIKDPSEDEFKGGFDE